MLLGDAQEAAGAEQALLGVLPAHERLDGDRGARLEVEDRLVDEPQLVVLERPAQAVLDLQPVAQPAAHRAVEDLERAAAAGLDALERGVGALDEVGAVIVLDGDADRGAEVDSGHRGLERLREPLGERRRLALVAHSASTANSSPPKRASGWDGVERLSQPRRDLDQHLVADRVPVRVVDRPEAVQPDAAARRHGRVRSCQRLLQPLLEEEPVRQAGERVVQRLVGDALLQPAAPR